MSEFKVGEIAIYVRPGSPHFGREVTIIGPLQIWGGGLDHITGARNPDGIIAYPTDLPPVLKGNVMGAKPEWLKKKQQKRDIDQLVSWSDCLWQPKGVTSC